MIFNIGKAQPTPVVRPATQAGRFYESDPTKLSREVDNYLKQHADNLEYEDVAALIVPHAGYYFSGNVAASAYVRFNPERKYKRIFLLGPSHHEWLNGASVNVETDYYATPLGQVKVDKETGRQLMASNKVFSYQPKAHDREHCLEVQLPFLQRRLNDVPPIVPIIISTNEYQKLEQVADALLPYFTEDNLFIISSDFSHYPAYADACKVDAKTGEAIASGDVNQFIYVLQENTKCGIKNLATSACGSYPIISLMLMFDSHYKVKHLLYQNSGDIDNHDNSRVVGYHSFAVIRNSDAKTSDTFFLSDEDKQALKQLAFQSIKDKLEGNKSSVFNIQSSIFNMKCGAFVSLYKKGRLRGCIGHFGEDYPLHQVVAEMARSAAFNDPRFEPLSRKELDDIEIEISVLTPMRRIQSIDEFQLHKHGIYVRKGRRSGTYLPQVADEVNWTKEEFVSHCSQDKAGLGWNGWRDAELFIYEAIVF